MPKSLTRDLIFFISGCFVLTLIWPNLEYEFALYGVAIENGQWYRLFTVAPTTWLNRKHTIFGQVTDPASQKVIDAIATVKTGANDKPVQAVKIESVTIK